MELSLPGAKVPPHRTFAPGSESQERKFQLPSDCWVKLFKDLLYLTGFRQVSDFFCSQLVLNLDIIRTIMMKHTESHQVSAQTVPSTTTSGLHQRHSSRRRRAPAPAPAVTVDTRQARTS